MNIKSCIQLDYLVLLETITCSSDQFKCPKASDSKSPEKCIPK